MMIFVNYVFNNASSLLLSFSLLYTDAALTLGTEVPLDLSPVFVNTTSGSSFSLTCDFQVFHSFQVRVEWMFSDLNGTYDAQRLTPLNTDNRFHWSNGQYQSTLTLINVTVNDSGFYFCRTTREFLGFPWEGVSNKSEVVIGKGLCKINSFVNLQLEIKCLQTIHISLSLLWPSSSTTHPSSPSAGCLWEDFGSWMHWCSTGFCTDAALGSLWATAVSVQR